MAGENAYDLTLAATVATQTGISAADTALPFLITAASEAILEFMNRKGSLLYVAAGVEKVAGYGTPRLLVERTPILAITSIVEVAGGSSLVEGTDYEIEDALAGFLHRIDSVWPFTGRNRPGIVQEDADTRYARKEIAVTYTGGWVTPGQKALNAALPAVSLPSDIQMAAIETVLTWYRGRKSAKNIASEALGQASMSYRNPNSLIGVGAQDLPDSARAMVARYIRPMG